jgi:hypothetical protein
MLHVIRRDAPGLQPPGEDGRYTRMVHRTAADILTDLKALDRENDRLELRLALAAQSLRAAEAHAGNESNPNHPAAVCGYLNRAAHQLRPTG